MILSMDDLEMDEYIEDLSNVAMRSIHAKISTILDLHISMLTILALRLWRGDIVVAE